MKVVLRLLAIAAVLCVMPGLWAADPTGTAVAGTWKGSFDFQGNPVDLTFDLKTDGKVISGTVEGLPTTPAEIQNGTIQGDTLNFAVNTDYEGQTYRLLFKGKFAADHIDFDFGTEDGSWGSSLTAKRAGATAAPAPADLTGVWKGSFDFQGNATPLTFNLKSDGTQLTGNVEGMGAAPVDIHDGKIDGDNVSFWVNTEYQGQTYAITFKGKLSNGQIDFSFGTADGSWGSTVTAKKS